MRQELHRTHKRKKKTNKLSVLDKLVQRTKLQKMTEHNKIFCTRSSAFGTLSLSFYLHINKLKCLKRDRERARQRPPTLLVFISHHSPRRRVFQRGQNKMRAAVVAAITHNFACSVPTYHHKDQTQQINYNDPSAGSPTETLLRLLLPLNDPVWTSSRRPTKEIQESPF